MAPTVQPTSEGSRYRYALVDPAECASALVLLRAAPALGIELTVPALAEACSLGNVDPQHLDGSRETAIERALEMKLPPPGTLLVTIRPDLDSLGAMAVLELRAAGGITGTVRDRVAEIASRDRGPSGPWPGPRPTTAADSTDRLEGIGAVVAQSARPLAERVRLLQEWLAGAGLVGLTEAAPPAVGESVRGDAWIALVPSCHVAVVRSERRGAVALGYCAAPVVIAENPRHTLAGGPPHRKVTIAQWEPGWIDMAAVTKRLAATEPGWGGSTTISGSPQGRDCETPIDRIVAIVEGALLPASRGRTA